MDALIALLAIVYGCVAFLTAVGLMMQVDDAELDMTGSAVLAIAAFWPVFLIRAVVRGFKEAWNA